MRVGRRWLWASGPLAVLAVLAACDSSPEESARPVDAGTGGAPAEAGDGATSLATTTFGPFEPWAAPIADYLAVGEAIYPASFNRAIVDLAPIGSRLFIGYGDATYNLGEKIPIEFRFFASTTEPTASASIVDGAGQGAPQTTPQQSGEEQIDRYRLLDGTLWQAGIDSIDADELHTQANTNPKGIAGNVYRLDGDLWRKFRSVKGGEHVHDVALWKGAVYAVGSGADWRTEFEAGQVFRYLWRSTDLGASFETVTRIQVANAGQGDTRWVTLLPTSNALYLFGYESVFATNTSSLRNASFDGQAVSALPAGHALSQVYVTDALALPDGSALATGLAVSGTVKSTAGHVGADGSFTPLSAFAGSTVLDFALTAGGEVVYLVIAGDQDDPAATSFDVRVSVASSSTPDVVAERVTFSTDVRPVSIAAFQGSLFLGTSDGRVLRSQPVP